MSAPAPKGSWRYLAIDQRGGATDPVAHGPPSVSVGHHQQFQFRVGLGVVQSERVAADLGPVLLLIPTKSGALLGCSCGGRPRREELLALAAPLLAHHGRPTPGSARWALSRNFAQRGREPSVRRMSLSSSNRCSGSVGERSNSGIKCA